MFKLKVQLSAKRCKYEIVAENATNGHIVVLASSKDIDGTKAEMEYLTTLFGVVVDWPEGVLLTKDKHQ